MILQYVVESTFSVSDYTIFKKCCSKTILVTFWFYNSFKFQYGKNIYVGFFSWTIYSAPLSDEKILSQIPHSLVYCCLTVNFEIRNSGFSHFFLLFKIILAIVVPFPFHANFRVRTRDSLEVTFIQKNIFGWGSHMCC